SGDPCNLSSLSLSQTSFDCGDVGSQIVTLTATDVNGNSSTCTSTVTVVDNVAPQALCQDVTVQLDAFGIGALNTDQIDGGSDDVCGISSLSLSQTSFGCNDVGIRSVTLTATDVNGNSSICTSTVTVVDNVAPQALCQDVTVQLDAFGIGALNTDQIDGSSGDACGISSLSLSQTSFDCSDVGIRSVTLTATDVNGNSSTCTANVTVVDNIAPQALCEDVTVQLDAFGNGTLNTDQIDGGSNDVCDISSLSLSQTSFDCGDVGSQIVTLTATDVNGNSSTCTSTVTVVDNVAPQALCQDVTVQLDAFGNGALNTDQIDGGSDDVCGISSLSLSQTSFDCSDVGIRSVTLTATDVNGNSSSCTSTVTVADNIAPQAQCQDLTVQLDEFGEGFLTAGQVNNGSNDACQIATLSLDKTEFSCDDVGAPTVTLTATDVNGNSSSCTANITVEDNIAPVAQCQDLTIQLGMNGSASITVADIENGSTDACGVSGLALDITTFGIADVGDNTVTLTVTDDNDNSSTCTATVTVENNFAPPTGGIESNRSQSKDSSVRYQAKVFPNPTLGVFTLRFEQPLQGSAHAILRNDLGQVISQVTLPEGTKDHRWANVYLAAGLYYLEVQHEDGNREVLKIVRKQF
ncbi:MAG: T9SS type A sorting domain-containing protein, partial [bacterium]|nr:T9SS type A sorting domain-containing protein [bacterium]